MPVISKYLGLPPIGDSLSVAALSVESVSVCVVLVTCRRLLSPSWQCRDKCRRLQVGSQHQMGQEASARYLAWT